jgi:hypothetical protein
MEDMMLDGLDLYLVVRRELCHRVIEVCGEQRHEESMSVRVLYVGTFYPARRVASEVAYDEDLDDISGEYTHYRREDEEEGVTVEIEVVQAVCGAGLDIEVGRHAVGYTIEY